MESEESKKQLQDFVADVGLPLLVKPAMGGGGKGMQVIDDISLLQEKVEKAQSEAWNAFANKRLIIEQYIPKARHIEVQILADQHSQTLILGERDCSLQRRHQKILEQAPAPDLSEECKNKLYHYSKLLAEKVSYCSTGTIEFIVPFQSSDSSKIYFLEMNTRLQVEHPVTEEVWGIDLVDWQFRIAAGEVLSKDLFSLQARGHSIELRLYAEDTEKKFLPTAGSLKCFYPHWEPGVRWELGVDKIDEVSSQFDPMIAKLVCTARDYQSAWKLAEKL